MLVQCMCIVFYLGGYDSHGFLVQAQPLLKNIYLSSEKCFDVDVTVSCLFVVLELAGKVCFDFESRRMYVDQDALKNGGKTISYDLMDDSIYSNKEVHVTITELSGKFCMRAVCVSCMCG